jgi:hypothetical protein
MNSSVLETAGGVVCGNCTKGHGRDRTIVRHASSAAVRLCFSRRYNPGAVTEGQRAVAAAKRSQAAMDADDAAMNAMVQEGERREDERVAAEKWARDLRVAFVDPTQD